MRARLVLTGGDLARAPTRQTSDHSKPRSKLPLPPPQRGFIRRKKRVRKILKKGVVLCTARSGFVMSPLPGWVLDVL